MSAIHTENLPEHALLQRYARGGHFTDCYATTLERKIALADLIRAFYSSMPFRMERWILRWVVSRPSSDAELQALAAGTTDRFAAWTVEAREDRQILLSDFRGSTRSWLMVEPLADAAGTRLYFGSAVVGKASRNGDGERKTMHWSFRLLMGFHQRYSVILLSAARRRLLRAAG